MRKQKYRTCPMFEEQLEENGNKKVYQAIKDCIPGEVSYLKSTFQSFWGFLSIIRKSSVFVFFKSCCSPFQIFRFYNNFEHKNKNIATTKEFLPFPLLSNSSETNIYFNRSLPKMSWKSDDEVNRNLATASDSEEAEEGDAVSVASTKFSYFSINSSRSEKSRKQARLSNYAFCIQVSED